MSDKIGAGCDPIHFALRVAAASNTLARLHRTVVASDALMQPECEAQNQAPRADVVDHVANAATVRKRTILKLTERLAAAAGTLAQSHKKAISSTSGATCGEVRESVVSSPFGVKLMSLMARDTQTAARRQARNSAVPHAWEVKLLGPEWVQHRLARQMIAPVVGELDQVHSVSDRQVLKLTCPLSGGLIRVPVRGHNCQHIDCFDLESLRQSAPSGWRCPMVGCTGSVLPDMLRRDSFVEAVLLHVDGSHAAISICPKLASATAEGSIVERATILARIALSLDAPGKPPCIPKVAATKESPSRCASVTIEIEDSDSEASPQSKRNRRTLRGA